MGMTYEEYADSLRKNQPAERDTILRWAREDSEISVKQYLELERLDVEIAEQERRKKKGDS